MYMTRRANNNEGFAIIEAVISLSVFAIGILALSSLYHKVINNNLNAYTITEAVELTSGYLDQIQAAPYNNIPSTSSLSGHKTYNVSTSVTPCDPATGTCITNTSDISVTITKPNGTSYTFSTVKARLRGLP
jgi:Tfp pilus assembly protein PilV